MNDIQLAKLLGLVSLGIGASELFYAHKLKKLFGLPLSSMMIRIFGIREIISSSVALAHPDNAGPIGVRIAGDALDLAVLATALTPGNPRRNAAGLATLAVIGVTALDVLTAATLGKQQLTALKTAERTRVKVLPASPPR